MQNVPGPEEIELNPDLDRWTLPHTEIRIHRVVEGPRRGEFLFDPETVARAKEFYDRTKDFPYLGQPAIEDFSSFLEVYGGWNVSIAVIDALPAWMRRVAWSLAWWKWIVLFVSSFGEPSRRLAGALAHSPQRKPSLRSTWGDTSFA